MPNLHGKLAWQTQIAITDVGVNSKLERDRQNVIAFCNDDLETDINDDYQDPHEHVNFPYNLIGVRQVTLSVKFEE